MNAQAREEIREAVEDGRLTIEEAAAMWPADDPHHGIVQQAAQVAAEDEGMSA